MPRSPAPPMKRILLPLASILIGIAAALALVEIGLRLMGIEYRRDKYTMFDERRGWRMVPGARFHWRKEGKSDVQLNREGYRDVDHVLEKPEGVYRIAVLGDSMTVAFEVPFEQSFVQVLQKRLGRLRQRRVEVLNFGVRAYGTLQEWMTFNMHARAYKPDLVVLMFFKNDITDNSRELNRNPDLPYLVLEHGTQRIVMDLHESRHLKDSRDRWDAFEEWIRRHFRIPQVISSARFLRAHPELLVPVEKGFTPDQALLRRLPLERKLTLRFRPPGDREAVDRAWSLTDRIVSMLQRDVEKIGARLVVAVVPDPVEVIPQAKAAPSETDERVRKIGRDLGLPVLTYTSEFRREASRLGDCLFGFKNMALCDGHLNPLGHDAMGRLLGTDLERWVRKD